MKLIHIFLISLSILLTGCQSSPLSYASPYDNPRNYPVAGSVIVLNQSLNFSPNISRSNIQGGVALGSKSYDRFRPWCQFYLHESKQAMTQARTIEADRFTVINSTQNVDYTQLKPIEVAAAGISIGAPLHFRSRFDDDIGAQTLKTTLWLKSENQPQVRELRCAIDDDPWTQNFLSINQIIETLGSVATLELPQLTQ
jgi:hypothetical protein